MLAFVGLAASPDAAAEDGKLDIHFYLRARAEAIDGQFRASTAPNDAALLLRTQITAEYDAGPIRIGGQIIDSRSYFQSATSSENTNEINAVEPVQAYIRTDFSKAVTITLGRFLMDEGNHRLISPATFRNSDNGFTGVKAQFVGRSGERATLFWTMPQTRLPDDRAGLEANRPELDRERLGLQFFGATVTSRPLHGTSFQAYTYRLIEHDAPDIQTRDRRLWTAGLRAYRPPERGKTDFEAEAAWQGGTTRLTSSANDRQDLPVAAWFAHGHVGHTLNRSWSPRLALQFDIASGNRSGGTYSRFDPLYGERVFEFGPASLFGATFRSNLVSLEGRIEVTPDKRWDGYVAVRPLWLQSATDAFSTSSTRDPAGRSGRYAGTQLDMRTRYWVRPTRLRLALGYANLFKGDFLNSAPNAPATGDTHYGYAELTLTL